MATTDFVVKNGLVVNEDALIRGGDITTDQTTFNLINATATTLNIGGAATTIEIGAASGITNINNTLDVDQTIFTDRFVKSPYAIVAPSGAFHKGLGTIFESFTIVTGSQPRGVVADPTRRFVYVSNNTGNSVSQYSVNQSTGELTSITTAIAAGTNPSGLDIDPNGKFLYVSNFNSNNVSQYSINQSTGALTSITTAIAAGTNPNDVKVDPTGRFAYVANSNNTVSQYSINQSTGALTSITTAIAAGDIPIRIAIDPTGRFAYVINFNSNNVSQYSINQSTGALTSITTAIAAGTGPNDIKIDPTGRFAYVANSSSNNINLYSINQSTGALTSVTTLSAGTAPSRISIDPTGYFLYVRSSNSIRQYKINQFTGELSLITTYTAPLNIDAMAIDPSSSFLYVTANTNGILSTLTINNFFAGYGTFAGNLTVTSTVSSVSTSTGALTVAGGTGITENLWVGGYINVDNLKLQDNTLSSTNTNGNIILAPAGTGNVGIGTSDPQRKLTIQSDNAGTVTTVALYNANTTNTNGTVVSFRTDTTGTGAATFHEVSAFQSKTTEHDHPTRNTNFSIFTDSATTGLTEKFTVTGIGRVGVGTNDPTELLDVRGNIALTGSIVFEGSSADVNETTISVTDPTADRTITFPDATGTVAVSVSDTTTTTQGELNLDFTLSAAGNISATGSAYDLSTTSTPTFAGLNLNGSLVFEGSSADAFETTLTVTDPTADNTITLPDATGTVAVSVSDTTTTTQGELNLDFTLSAAGNISATGTAQGLSTTSTPSFGGLYSGDIVVRGGAGASSEGAQITLGYGNNTTSTITGQSNNTWNIDVASGAANNDFRIFRQNSSGATQVALQITESSGAISLPTNISAWDTTTPGTNVGGLHLGAASSTANAGPAITFGARDTGSGATAQAGIYVTSDGTFGTRMYLATTDSYSNGSTAAMSISETGVVRILRNTASTSTTTGSLIVAGGVGISGALNATTKSFDIPHPTQPGKKLRYGSLEGPEFGVYVRGRLTNNNLIQLPEYWTKLVHSDSITVTLTPVGNSQNLYVKEIQNNIVYIEGSEFIDCFYTVWAERKDIDKLVVEGG